MFVPHVVDGRTIGSDDGFGVVGRPVIDDDRLYAVDALPQDAVERVGQVTSPD